MMQNEYLPKKVLIPQFGLEEPITGVEIGVAGACGSSAILAMMPNVSRLVCIDPWKHVDKEPFEMGGCSQEQHDAGYEAAKIRLAEFGPRALILRMTSDEAVDQFEKASLHFVHIDGHHTYEQAKRDILNYFPKIKPGGILSGHDFLQVPDVTRAIYEVFSVAEYPIYVGDDFVWWTYV